MIFSIADLCAGAGTASQTPEGIRTAVERQVEVSGAVGLLVVLVRFRASAVSYYCSCLPQAPMHTHTNVCSYISMYG